MAKVLQIEELEPFRDFVRESLRVRLGHQVVVTTRLEEGRKLLVDDYFPLVILNDEQLTGSTEQKIEFLREFTIGTPVILTTQPGMKEQWLACGGLAEENIVAVLAKPFHLNELIGAVEQGLEDKQFRKIYTVIERRQGWKEGEVQLLHNMLKRATPLSSVSVFLDESCPKTVIAHPLVPTKLITTFFDGNARAWYANDRTCPFPASL